MRDKRPQFLPSLTERGLAELYPPNLRIARTREESHRIDVNQGPQIVISASGMATGGRILHHLAAALPVRDPGRAGGPGSVRYWDSAVRCGAAGR